MAISAFSPRTPEYPKPAPCFLAVDLDDRVVDVDHHSLTVPHLQQRCPEGKALKDAGGNGVELADVPELELAQNDPSVDGAYVR